MLINKIKRLCKFLFYFNDIDNKKYMNDFAIRLKGEGWQVSIKPYDWYGWDSTSVMTAKSSANPN
jgi:hypothetical protein